MSSSPGLNATIPDLNATIPDLNATILGTPIQHGNPFSTAAYCVKVYGGNDIIYEPLGPNWFTEITRYSQKRIDELNANQPFARQGERTYTNGDPEVYHRDRTTGFRALDHVDLTGTHPDAKEIKDRITTHYELRSKLVWRLLDQYERSGIKVSAHISTHLQHGVANHPDFTAAHYCLTPRLEDNTLELIVNDLEGQKENKKLPDFTQKILERVLPQETLEAITERLLELLDDVYLDQDQDIIHLYDAALILGDAAGVKLDILEILRPRSAIENTYNRLLAVERINLLLTKLNSTSDLAIKIDELKTKIKKSKRYAFEEVVSPYFEYGLISKRSEIYQQMNGTHSLPGYVDFVDHFIEETMRPIFIGLLNEVSMGSKTVDEAFRVYQNRIQNVIDDAAAGFQAAVHGLMPFELAIEACIKKREELVNNRSSDRTYPLVMELLQLHNKVKEQQSYFHHENPVWKNHTIFQNRQGGWPFKSLIDFKLDEEFEKIISERRAQIIRTVVCRLKPWSSLIFPKSKKTAEERITDLRSFLILSDEKMPDSRLMDLKNRLRIHNFFDITEAMLDPIVEYVDDLIKRLIEHKQQPGIEVLLTEAELLNVIDQDSHIQRMKKTDSIEVKHALNVAQAEGVFFKACLICLEEGKKDAFLHRPDIIRNTVLGRKRREGDPQLSPLKPLDTPGRRLEKLRICTVRSSNELRDSAILHQYELETVKKNLFGDPVVLTVPSPNRLNMEFRVLFWVAEDPSGCKLPIPIFSYLDGEDLINRVSERRNEVSIPKGVKTGGQFYALMSL